MLPKQKKDIFFRGYFATIEFFEGKCYILHIESEGISDKAYYQYKTAEAARRGFQHIVHKYLRNLANAHKPALV